MLVHLATLITLFDLAFVALPVLFGLPVAALWLPQPTVVHGPLSPEGWWVAWTGEAYGLQQRNPQNAIGSATTSAVTVRPLSTMANPS